MRLGKVVCTKDIADTDEKDLAHLMVGRDIELGGGDRKPVETEKQVLAVHNVSMTVGGVQKLDSIDLEVHPCLLYTSRCV